jgi:hypothetical protein
MGLLADIRGGAKLRKVDDSVKRDRSAALPGGTEAGGGSAAPAASAAAGGMAGALASALAQRKAKVANSGKLCCVQIFRIMGANLVAQMTRMTPTTGEQITLRVLEIFVLQAV